MASISFDIPEDLLAALPERGEDVAASIRLAAAIYWYQRAEISQEQAARFAGLDRTDFLFALAREGVDSIVVDFDDLRRELARG